MSSENWLYLIIGLVVFNFLFSTVLDFVNGKNWRTEIPPVMKDFYDEKYKISADMDYLFKLCQNFKGKYFDNFFIYQNIFP